MPSLGIGAAVTGDGSGSGIGGRGAMISLASERRLGGEAAPSRPGFCRRVPAARCRGGGGGREISGGGGGGGSTWNRESVRFTARGTSTPSPQTRPAASSAWTRIAPSAALACSLACCRSIVAITREKPQAEQGPV